MKGIENYNSPPSELPKEDPLETEKSVESETFDFNFHLGEGFDGGFFENKLDTFPRKKMYDGWNDFLLIDSEDLSDRTIDRDLLTAIFDKLTGHDDTPMMFPVFIQGLQGHCENNNFPSDHITPERMQHFYDYMLANY